MDITYHILDEVYYLHPDRGREWIKSTVISTGNKKGIIVAGYGPPVSLLRILPEQEYLTLKSRQIIDEHTSTVLEEVKNEK